jgi:branched-chain amino acid transport system substrate-binding protein
VFDPSAGDGTVRGNNRMSKALRHALVVSLSLGLVATGCGGLSEDSSSDTTAPKAEQLDYKALGLWDDGPCDESKPKLVVGQMVVFESPVISMKDQALALEASAAGFNKRGGANGSCIEVHTCDDGANPDQSLACVKELAQAGVVATINDQGTAAQTEVSAGMTDAGIPRIASNVTPNDWADPNAYPTDASGTGFTFLLPQALLQEGAKKIGLIRVDLAQASALTGFLDSIYHDDGVTFPADVPVPAGTTDYSQFILAAQDKDAEAVGLAIGQQEAVQVVRAGQQLDTKMLIGTSTGTMSYDGMHDLGDFAKQLVLLTSYPPAMADLPAYEALRADFVASGEEMLRPEVVASSPLRSWIGLYALLRMIRDAKLTDFTGKSITSLLRAAKGVPMLDMFGGENWTPNLDHPGTFKRAGTNYWGVYRWDPAAKAPGGLKGNFVETGNMSFDKVLCGSPLGAKPPC